MTDVRPAAPADYDRIIAVVDDWWGREIHPVLPRLFLDHFHRTSLVAETRGDLAAFLVGFLSPSDADTAYIHFAGVAPAHRGTGLARRLYEAFFAMARADARTTVRALTSPPEHRVDRLPPGHGIHHGRRPLPRRPGRGQGALPPPPRRLSVSPGRRGPARRGGRGRPGCRSRRSCRPRS
ncbi:GNAT family N-acetyltransferase [Actinomadura madurae]|uniref:GNAT family N-acetyltransferase n=1 Tax=Actinomadura madurae TaxID=1993 RepID=UPI0027E257A3|nr:GNAT family N-acetyltransferase [Actinomadura madurae]